MAPGHGHSDRTERQHQSNLSTTQKANIEEQGVLDQGLHETGNMNSDIPERFNRNKRLPSRHRSAYSSTIASTTTSYDLKLNSKIRRYIELENSLSVEENDESWLGAGEIPTNKEVNLDPDALVSLPANRVRKPYKSVQKYISTQYQLLREDAVSPLRDAIDHFRKNPDMQEDQIVSVYGKVHIVGVTYTQNGIAVRIRFSTGRVGKRVLWSSSKRLTSGSIIAISPSHDNFNDHCAIAIVAARPLSLVEQSPPEVDIYFGSVEEMELDPHTEFVMIEAKSGYYEAHRYTLKALQKLGREVFPLSDHVLAKSRDIAPPRYLVDNPYKDLSPVSCPALASTLAKVNIIEAWPDVSATEQLDETQFSALEHMLTKRFAIIQGPPGTGKTHVSVMALKLMLKSRTAIDPPIIVAAQTNHALDQLLEHISKFEPEYIRLGGRSTNIEVKKRALYEVRKKERIANVPGSGLQRARTRLDQLRESLMHLLNIYDGNLEPISADTMHKLGVISEKQKDSLENAVSGWVSTDSSTVSAMHHWLHKSLILFQSVYPEEDYGFEEAEEDLELEQLKECEAEYGVSDEEDIETLKGPWQALSDRWTVVQPSIADIESAKKLLDSKDDLWTDVPEYLRGPMYWLMRQRANSTILSGFREAAREYKSLVEEIKIGRWEKDAVYLSRAKIIGMTTTGLSKYRPLIASLEPKIILIEEAAEVIEAPIAVACIESLEHLILVGDHLQLRGHCAVPELEGPDYNLNVSMFERLINLDMPFKTLLKQRRMTPEFRQLISSLYPGLVDHPDVLERHPPE